MRTRGIGLFLLKQFLACQFFLTGSDVGFRDASSRFRHKSVNAGRVLKLKLDSELKTSGFCGPASRSPARLPIFSAHPCARWHRSGRRFKYLYCVPTCATGPGSGLTASVPGAPADVDGEPGLSLTEALGQIFGSWFFAVCAASGLSALSGEGLRESHPFLLGHVDGCNCA